MIVFGFLAAVFGVSTAIDLTGCRPSQPLIINGSSSFTGEITSPGYKEGQNYPDNLFCEYTIRAPFGMRLKLSFVDMDVEVADFCMRDDVQLVELGQQERGLGIFCGNETYPPIVTSTNAVTVIFRSDFMVGRRGFRLRYEISAKPQLCDNPEHIPCRNRNCYSSLNRCDGKDDCGDGTDEEKCGLPLAVEECGIRKISSLFDFDRIIGGKEAVPGSWPWQADLQFSYIYPNGHSCGGTLINSQWVVTAAHCFTNSMQPWLWRIHLGNHHKFKKDAHEQIRYVDRIILYPGTTGSDLLRLRQIDMTHDLALLKLNAPVSITHQVRPACLPNQGYELQVGTKCMASGWGITRGTGAFDALKELDLTVQVAHVCTGNLGPIIEDTMICLLNSAGNQDICHGDSGGPLVCEMNNKWYVMGASSYGSEATYLSGLCGIKGSATVYSKVSHKTNWINQQINKYS